MSITGCTDRQLALNFYCEASSDLELAVSNYFDQAESGDGPQQAESGDGPQAAADATVEQVVESYFAPATRFI